MIRKILQKLMEKYAIERFNPQRKEWIYRFFLCLDINRYKFARKFLKGTKVLNIACGMGHGSVILSKSKSLEVIGIDNDIQAILQKSIF